MTQKIMEQIHGDMRQGASEAIDELSPEHVKAVMLSVINTSYCDPHLLAQIHTMAVTLVETEKRKRLERTKRRAFHPIHNPDGDHTWDRSRGYTGGTDSWE